MWLVCEKLELTWFLCFCVHSSISACISIWMCTFTTYMCVFQFQTRSVCSQSCAQLLSKNSIYQKILNIQNLIYIIWNFYIQFSTYICNFKIQYIICKTIPNLILFALCGFHRQQLAKCSDSAPVLPLTRPKWRTQQTQNRAMLCNKRLCSICLLLRVHLQKVTFVIFLVFWHAFFVLRFNFWFGQRRFIFKAAVQEETV